MSMEFFGNIKIDRIFRNFKESINKSTNVIQIDKDFHVRAQSAFLVYFLFSFRKGSYIKCNVPIELSRSLIKYRLWIDLKKV